MTNFVSNQAPPHRIEIDLVHELCDLYKLFHKNLKLFPKFERFSLGLKTETLILEILELLLAATYATKSVKFSLLKKASDKIDLLKYLFRFAYETKSLNTSKYAALAEMVATIGRMVGGWLKSQFFYNKNAP